MPLAWLTGVVVYSMHDGRLGRRSFSLPGDWIDIHGTIGVVLLGQARLNQAAQYRGLMHAPTDRYYPQILYHLHGQPL